MAPTEESILLSFLLPAAPLQQVITIDEFTALFPRALQSHPRVESMYREFQHQRAVDTDDVKRNVAGEVKRGLKYKREVARARQRGDAGSLQETDLKDLSIEAQMFGPTRHHPSRLSHTLDTLQPAVEEACVYTREENAALEARITASLERIRTIMGDLSDLRYGKFARPAGRNAELGEETMENLQRLEKICNDLGKG